MLGREDERRALRRMRQPGGRQRHDHDDQWFLAGSTGDGRPHAAGRVPRHRSTDARHLGVLTHGETRVLRYLPTNLSAPEIAGELYLSVNIVRTHQRHLYQKLGARSRTQAVAHACALGLLAPSPRRC